MSSFWVGDGRTICGVWVKKSDIFLLIIIIIIIIIIIAVDLFNSFNIQAL